MQPDDPTGKHSGEVRPQGTGPEEPQSEESIVSAAGVAETANRAMEDTVQEYLGAVGIRVNLEDIENNIRDNPLFYLAFATGAGFLLGGGMETKMGSALLGLLVHKLAAETATNFGREILRQATGRASSRIGPSLDR